MAGLHHKYICPMIDYFEEDRCHFVVMELEKGGDLCERLNEKGTYEEGDAKKVAKNVIEAMEFVHDRGYAHCDIKPRNYLLRSKRDDVDVRLADFGFAQHVHAPNSLTSQCGTPFFVAPEVINRKPYDYKVDMWSIGITCYLLLCGDTPFNGKNRQQLFRRISVDEPSFADDKWGHISDDGVDFVRQLLHKDPAKRMSAADALSHPWLADLVDPNHHSSMGSAGMLSSASAASGPTTHNSNGERPENERRTIKKSDHHAVDAPSSAGERPARRSQSREPKLRTSGTSRTSKSRERVKDRATSREPRQSGTKSRERERAERRKSRERAQHRASSREHARSGTRAPPPPPRAQARSPEGGAARAGGRALDNSTSSIENTRLLDHIKNQDAKIDKLERMLKRMLEPDDDVHHC